MLYRALLLSAALALAAARPALEKPNIVMLFVDVSMILPPFHSPIRTAAKKTSHSARLAL